jgi:hypothetical protein
MSNRQKAIHAVKVEGRERFFPLLTREQIENRLNAIVDVIQMTQEELTELGNPYTRHEGAILPMRGAHLTIQHCMLEKMFHDLRHDLDIVEKQADIVKLTGKIVGIDGNPIA